jgi:hypothetical protein
VFNQLGLSMKQFGRDAPTKERITYSIITSLDLIAD